MSARWPRVLTVSLLLLVAACAEGLRERGLQSVVSEQEERAQATRLRQQAEQFRQSQQARLERVLMRLLAAMPEPPRLTLEVVEADEVNAYVNGRRLRVPLGMLRFVKSDDEFAVVLGHELGHLPSVAHHGLLDQPRDEREREADVRGLLYAHRAGYDIRAGVAVFERMAVELSSGLGDAGPDGHPSHAERLVLAQKVADLLDRSGAEIDLEVLLKRLHHGPFSAFPEP